MQDNGITLPETVRSRLEALEADIGVVLQVYLSRSVDLAEQTPPGSVALVLGGTPSDLVYSHADLIIGGTYAYDTRQLHDDDGNQFEADGVNVGTIRPRVVYDYVSVIRCARRSEQQCLLLDALEQAICDATDEAFCAEYDESQQRRQREALERYASSLNDGAIATRRQTIDQYAAALVDHGDSIATARRQLITAQRELDVLLTMDQSDAHNELLRQWDQLAEHPRIASMSFVGDAITLTTSDDLRLYREDTGESRWLGSFRIMMNVPTRSIVITNLSTKRGGRDHPHVTNGRPCLGGHHEDFSELIGRGELYVVFELLLQYLETLNQYDEYGRYGSYWFDVEDERPLVTDDELVTA